ncbi:MarR family winged helix-turn-helix transcriptional regulator [Streptomyces cyaneofuscatus]|uniref:MarR family winged helix-turn-helix transcriptional regulator n=1 Tax=Streptomyces cyaneofuscatus TaxID=66883 RepID=UPI0034451BE1
MPVGLRITPPGDPRPPGRPAGLVRWGGLVRRGSMDRSDVVAMINELAERGQVERTPDPDDRRRDGATLTAAGRRPLRELPRAVPPPRSASPLS